MLRANANIMQEWPRDCLDKRYVMLPHDWSLIYLVRLTTLHPDPLNYLILWLHLSCHCSLSTKVGCLHVWTPHPSEMRSPALSSTSHLARFNCQVGSRLDSLHLTEQEAWHGAARIYPLVFQLSPFAHYVCTFIFYVVSFRLEWILG